MALSMELFVVAMHGDSRSGCGALLLSMMYKRLMIALIVVLTILEAVVPTMEDNTYGAGVKR